MVKIKKESEKMKRKCWDCGGFAEETIGIDTDGLTYRYWKCKKCGSKKITREISGFSVGKSSSSSSDSSCPTGTCPVGD